MSLLTQADIQAYAPTLDLSGYAAATVSGMISRAQARAAEFCQVDGFEAKSVVGETERAIINNDGDLIISVRRPPLQSLSAIRLVGSNVNVNLQLTAPDGNPFYFQPYGKHTLIYPSNFLIYNGIGLIGLRNARLFYQLDYLGGYDSNFGVPESLKEAISLYVQDMTVRNVNAMGAQSFTQGKFSASFGPKGASGFVSAAEAILSRGDYVRRVL